MEKEVYNAIVNAARESPDGQIVILTIGPCEDDQRRALVRIGPLLCESKSAEESSLEQYINNAINAIFQGLTYPDDRPVRHLNGYDEDRQYPEGVRTTKFTVWSPEIVEESIRLTAL